jgi:MarR family transcriptional regulator, transcriptional regulator for hemolysin
MRPRSPQREFAFLVNDVGRLLRTYADQQARQFGMTRAQWAVLARLEYAEGLKQAELADLLDLQPITLTRLVDRLCTSGLIERRADPSDRRAKRLYLTARARPLMNRLADLGENMMATVLEGLDAAKIEQMTANLSSVRDNLRAVTSRKQDKPAAKAAAAA